MEHPIDRKFRELHQEGRKGLIPFLTAGDPSMEASKGFLQILMEHGADLIEVGVPFSDPMAEGPTIQQASARALAAGADTDQVFDLIRHFKGGDTPILLMLYLNLVYRYGPEAFMAAAAEAGAVGLIIPDLPLEEMDEFSPLAEAAGLRLISLVAPSTGEGRLKEIAARSKGFLYCVSSMGVTGVREAIDTDLDAYYKRIRTVTDLPLALGFGLKSREQVEKISGEWDAFIVGSALVNLVAEQGEGAGKALGDFADSFKELK